MCVTYELMAVFIWYLLQHNSVHVIYAWNDEDPTSSEEFLRHETHGRGHTMSVVSFKDDNHDHHGHGSGATTGGGTTSLLMVIGVVLVTSYLHLDRLGLPTV